MPTTMDHLKKLGDKGWAALDVIGRQTNKVANKLGTESFWPMPLDKECEKAAAILRTFTRDGFQVKMKDRNGNKSMFKVPPKVLQQAKGLAIFTVFRAGFQISGAGGSGILIARQPDGTFGPPSGILLHTLGVGFLFGMDIYDTLLVLRTQEAVNAFAHPKISLGAELSVAAGPLGSGRALDMGFTDRSPAWVYTKSKGFYAGLALDGTVMIERSDENARYYGRKIKAAELIKGEANVGRSGGADKLVAAIEVAEGRHTVSYAYRPTGPRSSWDVGSEFGTVDSKEITPPLPARPQRGFGVAAVSARPAASSSRHPFEESHSPILALPTRHRYRRLAEETETEIEAAKSSPLQDHVASPAPDLDDLYEDAPAYRGLGLESSLEKNDAEMESEPSDSHPPESKFNGTGSPSSRKHVKPSVESWSNLSTPGPALREHEEIGRSSSSLQDNDGKSMAAFPQSGDKSASEPPFEDAPPVYSDADVALKSGL